MQFIYLRIWNVTKLFNEQIVLYGNETICKYSLIPSGYTHATFVETMFIKMSTFYIEHIIQEVIHINKFCRLQMCPHSTIQYT